jgi:RimJ/RimL family protein N-acetyltransferase
MVVPEIRTERLLLRAWRDADVAVMARICSDAETMRYMLPPRPLTHAEAALDVENLGDHWLRHGFGHWAVEELGTGRLIGRTGIKRHPDWPLDPLNMEVGWLYDRAVWGRGLATEGARAAVWFCFEELARPEVISIAHPHNAASRRVMEKAGFSFAGEGRWEERGLDVVWYRRRRSQRPAGREPQGRAPPTTG